MEFQMVNLLEVTTPNCKVSAGKTEASAEETLSAEFDIECLVKARERNVLKMNFVFYAGPRTGPEEREVLERGS